MKNLIATALLALSLIAPQSALAQSKPPGGEAAQPAAPLCPIGASLEVEWNGTWWAASILQGPNGAGACLITYDEWSSDWDEWVGPERMRGVQMAAPTPPATCEIGTARQVEWNGTWWAARILDGPDASGQCYITYDEWSAEWDEWVGQDRIR